VGLRPFVYRRARRHGLTGWVRNEGDAVLVEVQGRGAAVGSFLEDVQGSLPPGARLERLETCDLDTHAEALFEIAASRPASTPEARIMPDRGWCSACQAEVLSPPARRYQYPFTTCSDCGPRYTILEALPYDRARTAMNGYARCAACAREYDDPSDRRFHTEAIACAECGPQLQLLDADGCVVAEKHEALVAAAAALSRAQIIAVKGVGGFHLMADATDTAVVMELRRRKGRDDKPLAVMFANLDAVRAACAVSSAEEALLLSAASPVVLLRRLYDSSDLAEGPGHAVSAAVAPRNRWLGAMLPYTPLHGLLMRQEGKPMVCTSANLADEPLCIDNTEALLRLKGMADGYLVHDRPILRPLDDSVVRISGGSPQVLRRARGYAPLALPLPRRVDAPCVLALGGHLKCTITMVVGDQAVVGEHIGDLDSLAARRRLAAAVADMMRLLHARPQRIVCDLHPDYGSTQLAERLGREWNVPLQRVQHHHAHAAACRAEHGLRGRGLALVWDGAGLGSDGTLWGGEALVVDRGVCHRVAHLRPFSLVGGEQAMREPRRAALGLLYEVAGRAAGALAGDLFQDASVDVLLQMLEGGTRTVRTSSMGRLFDAVAALSGVRGGCGYEGQAAIELELAAEGIDDEGAYPFPIAAGTPAVADWEPLFRAVLDDRQRGVEVGVIAARFHNSLVQLAVDLASGTGLSQVVLSGGCFQNLRLATGVQARLSARGFDVYMPRLYPTNDGGLSLGQAMIAAEMD